MLLIIFKGWSISLLYKIIVVKFVIFLRSYFTKLDNFYIYIYKHRDVG